MNWTVSQLRLEGGKYCGVTDRYILYRLADVTALVDKDTKLVADFYWRALED